MSLVKTPTSEIEPPAATAAMDRPRRTRGLVDEIVEGLQASIRDGQLKPGEKLPTEAEIMTRFDVSRTVVREALSKLQASGLVETRHGIGTFVLPPADKTNFKIAAGDFATLADVISVLELRISLEVESAGLAAQRRSPEQLAVDANGNPLRIDKAFSWENPFSAHGLMHMLIPNAHAGDPYRIDTLFLYMANMAWNSSMNSGRVMEMLTDKGDDGEYVIPRIIYSDAYASEMVAYADLILPDTTYLERHDCISLLDRPICDADGVADCAQAHHQRTDHRP